MTKLLEFGKDADGIRRYLSAEMPALNFIVWDLRPFIPHMHNWRRNIIFIECDKVAVDSVAERLGSKYGAYDIYVGIKKPAIRINREGREGIIVITAREATKKREIEEKTPKIEKCLVDLLYYSVNEILPLSLPDVLDLWTYYLADTDLVRYRDLYRYSMRRYLGWFVSIFAYELSRKHRIKIDERHVRRGQRNMELVEKVQKLE